MPPLDRSRGRRRRPGRRVPDRDQVGEVDEGPDRRQLALFGQAGAGAPRPPNGTASGRRQSHERRDARRRGPGARSVGSRRSAREPTACSAANASASAAGVAPFATPVAWMTPPTTPGNRSRIAGSYRNNVTAPSFHGASAAARRRYAPSGGVSMTSTARTRSARSDGSASSRCCARRPRTSRFDGRGAGGRRGDRDRDHLQHTKRRDRGPRPGCGSRVGHRAGDGDVDPAGAGRARPAAGARFIVSPHTKAGSGGGDGRERAGHDDRGPVPDRGRGGHAPGAPTSSRSSRPRSSARRTSRAFGARSRISR